MLLAPGHMGNDSEARPKVSVIIPAFNKWAYTFKCLVSLAQQTRGQSYETLVVDNASADETRIALPKLEGIQVLRNEQNLGFAKACNQGAKAAKGRYLLFLNNDTEALPGWLPPLVAALDADSGVAAVGAKLLFPDGTLQHAGVAIAYGAPQPITAFHLDYHGPATDASEVRQLQAVTAACMMVRADAFQAAGGFDEGFINGYEDVDLCLRLRERGGRILYVPASRLVHHESVSDGRFAHVRHNIDRLHQKWMGKLESFDQDYRSRPPAAAQEPAPRAPATVVVVSRGAFDTLAPCLESALLHLGAKDELLVVDDGSSELTSGLVSLIAARAHGRLRVLRVPDWPGLGAALARAAAEARHDAVVVLGAQMKCATGFVDRLMHHAASAPDALVGGSLDPLPPRAAGTDNAMARYSPARAPIPFAPCAVPVEQLERFCVLGPRGAWKALSGQEGPALTGTSRHPLRLAPEVLLLPLVPLQRAAPSPTPGAPHG